VAHSDGCIACAPAPSLERRAEALDRITEEFCRHYWRSMHTFRKQARANPDVAALWDGYARIHEGALRGWLRARRAQRAGVR
jgi:hypothetical protein